MHHFHRVSWILLLFAVLVFPAYPEDLGMLYSTDFSGVDNAFDIHRQIWEVKDGRLYLSGRDPGGNFRIPYGKNSSTSFDLKLGDENSSLQTTLLWSHETSTGHTVGIGSEGVHEHSRVRGREVYDRFAEYRCRPGVWHHVRADLDGTLFSLRIDGKYVLETRLHPGFPDKGYLFFLSFDSKIWIDNLEILVPRGDLPDLPIVVADETDNWRVREIVPPAPIVSAPFDIIAAENGDILVGGPGNERLVCVGTDGTVVKTEIPWGGQYFDNSADGRIWFYNFPQGGISVASPGEMELKHLCSIEPTHFPGSISVSEDGRTIYFTSANDDDSRIYVYEEGAMKELSRVENDGDFQFVYSGVEVTPQGRVWVTGVRGVYTVDGERIVPFMKLEGFYPLSSSSDASGNLYVTAHLLDDSGIFKIYPDKTIEKVSALPGGREGPAQIGMFVDSRRNQILAVHKERHQVYTIRRGKIEPLLDDAFLSTPIALLPADSGDIYVNGDELGLQVVDSNGRVRVLTTGLVCWQPPAAGMAFHGNDLYYTGGAPGFGSFLYRIDRNGRVVSKQPINGIPAGIAESPEGNLYYTDYEHGTINKFVTGKPPVAVVSGLSYPVGLCIGSDGSMYVSASEDDADIDPHLVPEAPRRRIMKIHADGTLEEYIRFEQGEITFFEIGPDRTLYIPLGNAVYAVDPEKSVSLIADGFVFVRDIKMIEPGVLYLTDKGTSGLYRLEVLK